MADYALKDSGERQEFPTGAVRDTQSGKGRYDLLPVVALKRVAAVYEKGAQKYSDHNWTLGIPASRFMDSALRHLMQYSEGHRDEDHLAQAAFNILGLIHTESMVERGNLPASLMDLPSYVRKEIPFEDRLDNQDGNGKTCLKCVLMHRDPVHSKNDRYSCVGPDRGCTYFRNPDDLKYLT